MRIGEYDLEDEFSENANVPFSMKVKPNSVGKDPLSFEALYLIGFNENFISDDTPSDKYFYESLKVGSTLNKRKLKPPQVISSV